MTRPRSETFDIYEQGIYHCRSRCVRRAFLCGVDKLTGKNYEHRKDWILDRTKFLTSIFFVDLLANAIMCNHNHLLLRNRPDLLFRASDEDIASRWLRLFPKPGSKGKARQHDIDALVKDKERIELLRFRLGSISWFMACLNERISRMANKEDGVTGHFWEGRFQSTRLDDEASILSCMVYVDLNEIRSKMANSPEDSKFTSAYERIVQRQAAQQQEKPQVAQEPPTPSWLVPIQSSPETHGIFSDISLDEYLHILDCSGRELAKGKRGKIPEDLAPILERLAIKPENWLDACSRFHQHFGQVAGRYDSLKSAAKKSGRKWLKGFSAAKSLYC